jgi:hypothetical protein
VARLAQGLAERASDRLVVFHEQHFGHAAHLITLSCKP